VEWRLDHGAEVATIAPGAALVVTIARKMVVGGDGELAPEAATQVICSSDKHRGSGFLRNEPNHFFRRDRSAA
jgi:hypothetical protein